MRQCLILSHFMKEFKGVCPKKNAYCKRFIFWHGFCITLKRKDFSYMNTKTIGGTNHDSDEIGNEKSHP
jgi:hypothetical protein